MTVFILSMVHHKHTQLLSLEFISRTKLSVIPISRTSTAMWRLTSHQHHQVRYFHLVCVTLMINKPNNQRTLQKENYILTVLCLRSLSFTHCKVMHPCNSGISKTGGANVEEVEGRVSFKTSLTQGSRGWKRFKLMRSVFSLTLLTPPPQLINGDIQ